TALSAKVALVVGPICFYALVFRWESQVQAFLRSTFSLQSDVHFLHLLAFVFLAAVAGMAALSWWRPEQPAEMPESGQFVDMQPWRPAKAVSAAVAVAAIVCYVALAR
ncbi:MAG: solute:sodium symporter family transporter, partial [Planctomycetota bacterium]